MEVVVEYGGNGNGRLRVITFKAPVEVAKLLDIAARRMGMSKSELIRRALIEYLRRLGYDVPDDVARLYG